LGNGVAWRRKTARKGDRHEKKRWFVDCVFILLILATALVTLAGGYDKND